MSVLAWLVIVAAAAAIGFVAGWLVGRDGQKINRATHAHSNPANLQA